MKEKEQSFRDRLVDELTYRGISNKEFAEQVGISINTLNMYLYRNSIPAADVAVRMARILNTTTEYLVLGSPKENGRLSLKTQKVNREKEEIFRIIEQLPDGKTSSFLSIARAYKVAVES